MVKEESSRMPRTDSFQRYGTLTIQCFDRLTRKPLPGCAVCVSRVPGKASKSGPHVTPRRMKNAASTFGQATVSDEDVSSSPELSRHSSTNSLRQTPSLHRLSKTFFFFFSAFFMTPPGSPQPLA